MLESVRAGRPLSLEERALRDGIQVTLLQDIHREIDEATADAYGWPRDQGDAALIENLTALNAERAAEEAGGRVRWLRPGLPDSTSTRRAREPEPPPRPVTTDPSRSGVLIPFPRSPVEQPLAVEAVIRAAGGPLDAVAVARRFRRSRQIESRIGVVLGTLHRYSRIQRLDDGRYQSRAAQ